MDVVAHLTNLRHPFALFQGRRVLCQVNIDLRAQALKIDPFARCVGRADQPYVALLD
jgi:hypothetical protein